MVNIRHLVVTLLLPLVLSAQTPQQCVVEIFIGDPEFFSGDGGLATDAKFSIPAGVATSADGTVYVSDRITNHVRKIDPQGTITRFAGTGVPGAAGDGGLAIDAQLSGPRHLDLGPDGSVYVVDGAGTRIRRVTPDGSIETVYVDESARIYGLSVSAAGTVFFTDQNVGVLQLESDGKTMLIAGGGLDNADGIPALEFAFDSPFGVLASASGNILVTDRSLHRVFSIDPSGMINTLVGGGNGTFEDGVPALQAPLVAPIDIAENADGDLFITHVGVSRGTLVLRDGLVSRLSDIVPTDIAGEESSALLTGNGGQILRQNLNGEVTVVAGVDRTPSCGPGLPLDQSLAGRASGLQFDSEERLYYVDATRRIVYRTALDDRIEVFAGGGETVPSNGVVATDASLSLIQHTAIDSLGRFYVSADSNFGSLASIFRVETTGTITRIAGGGVQSAPLPTELDPLDINFDRGPNIAAMPDGRVFFDVRDDIYEIGLDGTARRVLSLSLTSFLAADPLARLMVGAQGFRVYDDLQAEPIFLGVASGVGAVASSLSGAIFYRDQGGQYLRYSADGTYTNFLPSGADFQIVNGKLPVNSALPFPSDLAVDQDGDLFIAGHGLSRIFVIRGADTCEIERPYVAAIRNGARFNGFGATPGELVSVFGRYLGGETLEIGAPGQSDDGTWQTSVGGLEVFVNDIPAPVIFSRDDQAAFIFPNETSGPVRIRFSLDGVNAFRTTGFAGSSSPGIFTANSSGGGQAAALNQDSSINSAANPAEPGSVIVLYLTGAGVTDPPSKTGSLNRFPLPELVGTVEVSINGVPAVVEFAGPAPGLVSGVVQINARIPAGTPAGDVTVEVKIGGASSGTSPTGEWPTIAIE